MKAELSEQDIVDIIGFLTSPNAMIPGNLTLRHRVLVQTLQAVLQPNKDGAKGEAIPEAAEEPTS